MQGPAGRLRRGDLPGRRGRRPHGLGRHPAAGRPGGGRGRHPGGRGRRPVSTDAAWPRPWPWAPRASGWAPASSPPPRPTPATSTARRWWRPPTRTRSAPGPIPGKPMRVRKNAWVEDWESRPADIQPLPQQAIASIQAGAMGGIGGQIEGLDPERSCFAMGQSAGGVRDVLPAGEIVRRIMERGGGGDWAGGGFEGQWLTHLPPPDRFAIVPPMGEEARRTKRPPPSRGQTVAKPTGRGQVFAALSPTSSPPAASAGNAPRPAHGTRRPGAPAGAGRGFRSARVPYGSGLRPATPWPRR